jgi:hypothetical protein
MKKTSKNQSEPFSEKNMLFKTDKETWAEKERID